MTPQERADLGWDVVPTTPQELADQLVSHGFSAVAFSDGTVRVYGTDDADSGVRVYADDEICVELADPDRADELVWYVVWTPRYGPGQARVCTTFWELTDSLAVLTGAWAAVGGFPHAPEDTTPEAPVPAPAPKTPVPASVVSAVPGWPPVWVCTAGIAFGALVGAAFGDALIGLVWLFAYWTGLCVAGVLHTLDRPPKGR